MAKQTVVKFPDKGSWKNYEAPTTAEYNREYALRHSERILAKRKANRNNTLTGRMTAICGNAKSRAKLKGWECEMTMPFLCSLWEKQEGRCAITGVKMSLKQAKHRWKGTQVSLDRIDPKEGYTKDNVWLVTTQVNYAKGMCNYTEFVDMCRLVLENSCE